MYNRCPFGSCQSSYPTVFRRDYHRVVQALLTLAIYHPHGLSFDSFSLWPRQAQLEENSIPPSLRAPRPFAASNCSWPQTLFAIGRPRTFPTFPSGSYTLISQEKQLPGFVLVFYRFAYSARADFEITRVAR